MYLLLLRLCPYVCNIDSSCESGPNKVRIDDVRDEPIEDKNDAMDVDFSDDDIVGIDNQT